MITSDTCTNYVLQVLTNSNRTSQANQGFVFMKYGEIVEQDALMSPNPSGKLEDLVVVVCV